MESARLLKLMLSWLTGLSLLRPLSSWTINVPKTVMAVEGSCAAVPCQTEPHSRVIWYQYHKTYYPVVFDSERPHNVEAPMRGRTSVPGRAAEGNCTLMIDPVRKTDHKLQVYVWINPDATASQKFYDQIVTIYVEKIVPTITIQRRIVDGETFLANCSVRHSCPLGPPALHWYRSPLLVNSTIKAFNQKVQGQWTYTETQIGLASYQMHKSQIKCYAKFESFTSGSREITLEIQYKPVSVSLVIENQPVLEGGSVLLECAADSNPQPRSFSWFIRRMGRETRLDSIERKSPFTNVTRHTSISCVAHNVIGSGWSDWVDLEVQYPPVILPESSCHQTGETVKCICHAEAYPNASLHWTIDGNYTLPSSFSFVSKSQKNVVCGELSLPAKSLSNVSCTATNSLRSSTKQLTMHCCSGSLWWTALLSIGVILFVGCVVLLVRKYFRDRPPPGVTTVVLRSEDEDTQSGPSEADQSEEEEPSCVYDNDIVEEIRQARAKQRQNNPSVCREDEIHQLEKNEQSNIYLNY